MILKASERSGCMRLGLHLLKTEENEHVEIHEVRGFVSPTILGAMKEIQAISMGTRCKSPVFSLSLNPPERESVRIEVFEKALDVIEKRLGLTGQPRVVVFHEKEGRRHCHAAWSRIDPETMTARNLSHWKNHLQQIGKQLFIENGWKLPAGLLDSKNRDPRNFTLDEWQKAKQAGVNIKDIKASIQACWSSSDDARSFGKALEEHGLFLARGDRRSHVAISYTGDVYAIGRMIGKHKVQVEGKLGGPESLKSVDEVKSDIAKALAPRLSKYISEAKRIAANQMKPLLEKRNELKIQHQLERRKLDGAQKIRREAESVERTSRLRHGWKGLWDRVNGEYSKVKAKNEFEAYHCLCRDREQRHELVLAQLQDRYALQDEILLVRERGARQLLSLYKEAAVYRSNEQARQLKLKDQFTNSSGRSERHRERSVERGRSLDLG